MTFLISQTILLFVDMLLKLPVLPYRVEKKPSFALIVPVDMFSVDTLVGVIVPVDRLTKLPVVAVKIFVLMILELVILEKKPLSALIVLTLSICLIDALSTLIINDDKIVDIPKTSLN